jgi:hypothetical protein
LVFHARSDNTRYVKNQQSLAKISGIDRILAKFIETYGVNMIAYFPDKIKSSWSWTGQASERESLMNCIEANALEYERRAKQIEKVIAVLMDNKKQESIKNKIIDSYNKRFVCTSFYHKVSENEYSGKYALMWSPDLEALKFLSSGDCFDLNNNSKPFNQETIEKGISNLKNKHYDCEMAAKLFEKINNDPKFKDNPSKYIDAWKNSIKDKDLTPADKKVLKRIASIQSSGYFSTPNLLGQSKN